MSSSVVTHQTWVKHKVFFSRNLCGLINQHQIKHNMVNDITPDGGTDGQCWLRLIDTLSDKVDTCMMYQHKTQSCGALVRQGSRAKTLRLRISSAKMLALSYCHVRVWGLTRKSSSYREKLGCQDTKCGPLYSQTRWATEFEQVTRNNLLRHVVDQSVENFKRKLLNANFKREF